MCRYINKWKEIDGTLNVGQCMNNASFEVTDWTLSLLIPQTDDRGRFEAADNHEKLISRNNTAIVCCHEQCYHNFPTTISLKVTNYSLYSCFSLFRVWKLDKSLLSRQWIISVHSFSIVLKMRKVLCCFSKGCQTYWVRSTCSEMVSKCHAYPTIPRILGDWRPGTAFYWGHRNQLHPNNHRQWFAD